MNEVKLFSIGLGLLLGGIHFFSDKFKPEEGEKHYRIFSFAAGISIAYLFLDLLPHTYEAATLLKNSVFIFLLLGFALFHLSEKYLYQHIVEGRSASTELQKLHAIAFFIYYFMVGLVLCEKAHSGYLEGILFLIPVGLHAALSTASLSEIHGDFKESLGQKIILSSSCLLGVIVALIMPLPAEVNNILVSFIAGIFLYIFVKEFLPEKKKGQPMYFVIGVLLFFIFFLFRNYNVLFTN
jgi:zinc transporter ZupT